MNMYMNFSQTFSLALQSTTEFFVDCWKTKNSVVDVHERYSAEYPCMVKVCAPCLGQRRVYMYITNMPGPGQISHRSFALHFCCPFVCYAPQERQKASRSGSPQNALHCLVTRQCRAFWGPGQICPGPGHFGDVHVHATLAWSTHLYHAWIFCAVKFMYMYMNRSLYFQ